MTRSERAADAAAAWIIRQEDGPWTAQDQAALDTWLRQSDGNKASYWRLRHSWQQADRIGALGMRPDVRPRRLHRWRMTALAASLAVTIGLGASAYFRAGDPATARIMNYRTDLGGYRRLALADGSRIELNTATVLHAAVSRRRRDVWLDDGEAFFDIAHDPAHPFVVHAGAKTITVLGTRFVVRRDGDRTAVTVVEGRVRIEEASAPTEDHARSTVITAGDVAISRAGSTLVTERTPQRLENQLAWRHGMLVFDDTPLAEAAGEINRYSDVAITVDDASVGSLRIGGVFKATNADAFARLLHDAYGLRVDREGNTIIVSRR